MSEPGDDISVDKVKAILQRKRADSGATPDVPGADPAIFDVDSEKVKEILRQTRVCAAENAQSSQQLKNAQTSTPGRVASRLKTKAPRLPAPPATSTPTSTKQKKEKSS